MLNSYPLPGANPIIFPFNKNLQKAISASSTLIGSILFFGIIGYYLSNYYENKIWLIGLLIL